MQFKKKHIRSAAVLSVLLLFVLFFAKNVDVYGYLTQLKASVIKDYRPIENEKAEIKTHKAKILFVGDIMMGRYVRTLINKNGSDYPFAKLPEDFFKGYNLVMANLEGPITKRFVTGGTSMVFGFPPDTGEILQKHGITTVTLGNNHTMNRGVEGVAETEQYLKDAGIEFLGKQSGESWEDSVLQKEINGFKITFISLHDAERDIDEDAAKEIIKKADVISDYVIVQPHWGIEYKHTANERQTRLAHDWIDNGADIIIGHHPHVVENMEIYNGKAIFYSLGNFIFDQYFSTDSQEEMALALEIRKSGVKFTLLPLKSARSQSYLMSDEEKGKFFHKMASWSGLEEGSDLARQMFSGEISLP